MYELLASLANIIGVVGVILLLSAYFAITNGYLSSKTLIYQCLNFSASWLILFSLCFNWNLPSVMIEIAWIMISVVGIVRIIRDRRKNTLKQQLISKLH